MTATARRALLFYYYIFLLLQWFLRSRCMSVNLVCRTVTIHAHGTFDREREHDGKRERE